MRMTQNFDSHIRWTGPQLFSQLPEINVFCTGMSSAGKSSCPFSFPSVSDLCVIFAVCRLYHWNWWLSEAGETISNGGRVCGDWSSPNAPLNMTVCNSTRVYNRAGDSIPGPQPLHLFDKIQFPWKAVTDKK